MWRKVLGVCRDGGGISLWLREAAGATSGFPLLSSRKSRALS